MSDPMPGAPAEPSVDHEGEITLGDATNSGSGALSGLLVARFVRYPGCQQLVVWLPQPGHTGYLELLVHQLGRGVCERAPVSSRLSGSVQILFDTLSWPPGEYRIDVTHAQGGCHSIALRKWPPGAAQHLNGSIVPPAPPAPVGPDPRPIVYRDGFGRVVPDADLVLRQQALAALTRRFLRRLRYEGTFRAGAIVYEDGESLIRFAHEMGSGACRLRIRIPAAAHWQSATGTALTERDDIVAFVAECVHREQTGGWRYEITPEAILFYGPTVAPNSGPSS
ncbi:MAG: hypothetical protein KA169_01315 [Burkholderiaceae bacterium]|nr:hypothetical protein [Burkholderiaceae bacterium]